MAFCRFGADGSNVYCFYSVGDFYEVWSCEGEHQFQTAKETIAFLNTLREKGQTIPQYAFDELEQEPE